jgi:hypothetical protein
MTSGRGTHRLDLPASLLVACLCATLAWCPTAKAQSQANRASDTPGTAAARKTSTEARQFGFLFPGGGQYYLGETRHGAAITAQTLGLLSAGTLTLVITNCTFHFSDMGQCTARRQFAQVAIGSVLIAAGAWVWARAAFEAGRHAQARTGVTLSGIAVQLPVDVSRPGSLRFGVSFSVKPGL